VLARVPRLEITRRVVYFASSTFHTNPATPLFNYRGVPRRLSPSLVMTAVVLPVGTLKHGCIGTVNFNDCGEEAWLKAPADYITICCDGGIINTVWSIWQPGQNLTDKPWNLDDFACCERDIWSTPDITTCSEGTHQTALASLAGTNTDNFQYWTDTYLTGMVQTPRCAWLGIGAGEVTTVTVARQTGVPDTTKVTDSSTTTSYSVGRSSSQSDRATATDGSVPTRQTTAPIATTSTILGNASETRSAPVGAQPTGGSNRVRSSWSSLLVKLTYFAVYVL
jgi:hypothetical protein